MKKFLEIFLSILAAMGGFVEIGELTFSLQAGAKFGYSLLWISLLGTIGIIVYAEMAGRVAAVKGVPVFYMIRDRMGYGAGLGTLVAANLISLGTCAAEIGAVAMLMKLAFGRGYRLWIVLGLLFFLLVVWFLSFQAIERIFGLLGLLMIVFLVVAVKLGPDWGKFGLGFVPNVPHFSSGKDYVVYAYFAVALLSSIMLPYEVYFYASGAIEDGWKPDDVTLNRIITIIGFSLGSLLGISLVVVGALLMMPIKLEPQLPGAAALAAASVYGQWGMWLALGGMFFCFGGAAIENALAGAYNLAQFCGWPWGKLRPPRQAARFSLAWIVIFIVGALIVLTGIDPVNLVEYSIVFAVVVLPLTYFPMLLAARDREVMGKYCNGWISAILGWFYLVVICVAALAAVPLLILTHGGKG